MRMLRYLLALPVITMGIQFASAEEEAQAIELINTRADYYDYADNEYGDYYLAFASPMEADGSHWVLTLDLWAKRDNQSGMGKNILPASSKGTTYKKSMSEDEKDTFYSPCSWVCFYADSAETQPVFVSELPDEVVVYTHGNGYYCISIVADKTFKIGSYDKPMEIRFKVYKKESGDDSSSDDSSSDDSSSEGTSSEGSEEGVPEEYIPEEEFIVEPPSKPTAPEIPEHTPLALETLHNSQSDNRVLVSDLAGRVHINAADADLRSLASGIYIVRKGGETHKIYKK